MNNVVLLVRKKNFETNFYYCHMYNRNKIGPFDFNFLPSLCVDKATQR